MEIVVNAETKNQASWDVDVEKGGWGKSLKQPREDEREEQPHAQTEGEGQEDCDATQPGKRRFMDMATVPREGNPSSARGHVSHLARRHKRHSQRERKYTKEQERQTPTSLPAETSGISGQARRTDSPSLPSRRSFPTKRRKFVIFGCRNYTSPGLRRANVLAAASNTLTPSPQANLLGTSPTPHLLQLKNLREADKEVAGGEST